MKRNLHFEKLTLNDNVDIDVYEEALDFAFSSSDIKNIAISGAYGAGKSSVLASYKNRHKGKKFMHISLAHFDDENSDMAGGGSKEPILEGKILNQLIHQISPNNIPQTNFKIKQGINKIQIFKNTFMFLTAVICTLFIFLHDEWISFISNFSGWVGATLDLSRSYYAQLIAGLLLLIIFYIFIYQLIQLQRNKKLFKRVNVQGTEIEIFENKDESYFDKYLNEVLYLFENSDVDAIVFEDMDRFEINQIFERLHEVNTLVNVRLAKQGIQKPLRFIYLLRDDVFVSKDRTKFFDYIIPVVPVLDGTNSYDQFILHLEKNDMYSKLNEKFLQGISLYVDDMRLLKNICNEFLIYCNRVNIIELDYDKMFALITYKNLFPRDFSDLQLGKGFIYSLFDKKDEFIKSEAYHIQELINAKAEEVQYCDNEELESLEELEVVSADKQSKANNAQYPIYDQKQKEYKHWKQVEFPKRQNAIKNKLANRSKELNKELDELNSKLLKLQTSPLKDIISRENIDEIFRITTTNEIGKQENYTEIKGSEYFDLLKYLVRHGYIDETYADYMTYFYENSVSRVDKIFLRSVADKKAKESNYELKDPKLVVSRLSISDFEEKETQNFYLLKYLIEEMPNSKQLERLVKQFSDKNNTEFIRQFFGYFHKWDHYVTILNRLWPSLFKEIIESNSFSQKMVHDYSIYTLYFSTLEELSSIDIDHCLTNYIINSPSYLNIESPSIGKLIDTFKYLDIKFRSIDVTTADKDLFKAVYEHSLYELNFSNIELMLSTMEHFTSKEEIQHKNFSLVMEDSQTPLFIYINDNIEKYMTEMLENCEGSIGDSKIVALTIINNTNISNELKSRYISYLNTTLDSLSEIKDIDLWDQCLNSGIMEFAEINIVSYFYSKKCFTPALICYINAFPHEIDMSKANIHKDTLEAELFTACLKCFEIENNKYKQFLLSMKRFYQEDFPVENVPNEKMIILIDGGIINLNEKSLKTIRKKYPEVCDRFIRKNFDTYVGIMSMDIFSFDELLRILDWDESDESKISLLEFTSKPISILDKSYTVSIMLHILKNNLEESDLKHLRKRYHSLSDEIQQFIFNDAVNKIDQITNAPADVSYNLIEALFASTQLSDDAKLSLLTEAIPSMSREQCVCAFGLIGREDYKSIFESRKKPKFAVNKKNENILIKIKSKGWIYEYYIDPNDDAYYRVRRNKPQKKLKVERL